MCRATGPLVRQRPHRPLPEDSLYAAGLCLAAAACSKDDIAPESAPQQGITPTRIIFNVTRGGYDGDAETRAPKSGWAEGDVVYFGRYNDYFKNKAIYTDGEWVVNMKVPITENTASLRAIYGEHIRQNEDINNTSSFYVDAMGDVAYTVGGSYKVDEGGVATITLNLDQHPQGRMTFTGVGKGKELTVLNMKSIKMISNLSFEFRAPAPITLTGEDDGTTTLYALPDPTTVTDAGITLTAQYEGKLYTKTFAGKEFKENSNITLAAPSLEGGWAEAVTEYAAADLKMGDYLYSDGTTSDGTLAGEVRGYAVAITDACLYDTWNGGVLWATKPNDKFDYAFEIDVSDNLDDWNGYANCQVMHDYVTAHAGEDWEMRHFQAAWSCETYGNRTLDYDGNPTSDYEWQAPLRAPAGTSGWFLPSCGQLWYMMPYQDYLNSRFMAAKEVSAAELQEYVKEFQSLGYWSSTKHDNYSAQAMFVNFKNRYRYGMDRNSKNLVSRAVIVF